MRMVDENQKIKFDWPNIEYKNAIKTEIMCNSP